MGAVATSPAGTAAAAVGPRRRSAGGGPLPPLENGDRLTAAEFLRRYEAMPEVKKAELVGGCVFMSSPVRIEQHGEPDSLVQGWLFAYAAAAPGVRSATNVTLRLGPDDVIQPDAILRRVAATPGRTRVDERGYLVGPPELVCGIAASSASVDVGGKKDSCRRAGVPEYLVWRTLEEAVDWWRLEEDAYVPIEPDAEGILRSVVFPGLRLDPRALLARDGAGVLRALQSGIAAMAEARATG